MRCAYLVALVGLLGAMLGPYAAVADDFTNVDRADQLRAGYLLNFVKFVEWPGGALDHWTLCFMGADGIRAAIVSAQAARQPGRANVVVKLLSKTDPLSGCQLLYVAADNIADDRSFDAAGQAVLTVSDAHDFIHHGGMIELFAEGNRLRFNINLENARRAGLHISSNLLQLASHIEESGR